MSSNLPDRQFTGEDVIPINQLLHTTELLEKVLDNLPLKDLVTIQRVCPLTNIIVKSSPVLQQKLFKRFDKEAESHRCIVIPESDLLLLGKTSDDFLMAMRSAACQVSAGQLLIYNPLVLHGSGHNTKLGVIDYYDDCSISGSKHRLRLDVLNLDTSSSCLSMFLTSPPVTSVVVGMVGRVYYSSFNAVGAGEDESKSQWDCIDHRKIYNIAGVTLRDVVDAVEGEEGEPHYIIIPNGYAVAPEQMLVIKDSLVKDTEEASCYCGVSECSIMSS